MFSKIVFGAVLAGALVLTSTSFAAGQFGADRHVARGVDCAVCHGPDKANPAYPDEGTCIKCHPKEALAAKTKGMKPTNPHAAPHNGDCTLCHLQHEPTENYCAQCHQFDFGKIP